MKSFRTIISRLIFVVLYLPIQRPFRTIILHKPFNHYPSFERSFRSVILLGFNPISARTGYAPYQSAATNAAANMVCVTLITVHGSSSSLTG